VAFAALFWNSGKYFVGVTGCTIDFRVETFQWEYPGVVKSVHTIGAIMALGAATAEQLSMTDHVNRLCLIL